MVKVKYQTAKTSSNVLLGCASILLLLAVLINQAGRKIDEHDTLHIAKKSDSVGIWKYVMIGLIMLVVLLSINLKIFLNKALAIVTINVLFVTLILFVIIRSQMIINYGIDESIVEENCALVNQNITIDNSTTDPEIAEVFNAILMADQKLDQGLNPKMCTTTCPCDGDAKSNSYSNISEETFNKYGRTKQDKDDFASFQWGSMVSSHKNVLDCLEKGKSIAKGVDDYAVPSVPFTDYKITWVKDSINYFSNDGLDKIQMLDKMLTPEVRGQLSFVENKYNCSGICRAPFFYVSQSIDKGPPQNACLPAIVSDVSSALSYMRLIITLAILLFLVMLVCSLLICFKATPDYNQMVNDLEMQNKAKKQNYKMPRN